MKNKFSIGQMARLNNISIKTLRYYDEIGLFKPSEVDAGTGYRYYSIEQFKELDIILYMKMMGVPLKDIKKQLENRKLDDFISVLENVRKITREKIDVLKRIEKGLFSRVIELEGTKDENKIEKPYIEHLQAHNMIQVNKKVGSLKEIEAELRQLKSHYEHIAPIVIGNVGYLKNIENQLENVNTYDGIFLLVDQSLHMKMEMMTPVDEGDFAVIRWREEMGDDRKYIEKLLRFARVHNYQTEGPLYIRKIVDGIISNHSKEWLKEIRVKIIPLTLH
ncbi:MerR family transcriptional regulator [Rummeliibacillus suwonensis]|jgi:DNA-binding transcriptional MerR regulator|uniref:MerR family transcriptional regulator n=1 Tax=Rummeliibacillus suwonensis TaxID=1306154 RepID=UPI0011B738CE|nr:helix-turn-helix domain-containing protein [Rummeliibacillus suwonensis]MBO2535254.1 MerR family transcriptional regulator [Rummeliibacillus suwonensis]